MLYLNNPLLTADGIINELKKINAEQTERLKSFKKKLELIYFPGMNIEEIKTEIESERFAEFPKLQVVLREIFFTEQHPGAINIAELADWNPPATYKTFQELNTRYGYFQEQGEPIFNTLQPLCRKMTQLVECQDDDNEMAYKLMVLFSHPQDFSDPGECLTKISKSFINISKPIQRGTAYHEIFVNILNVFPTSADAKNIQVWQQFIAKHGLNALYFFADCQLFTSAPETLDEAKQVQIKKKYQRANEDFGLAKLCNLHLIDNLGFEAGLDFIQSGCGWPKKLSDNLPLVDDIKVIEDDYEYQWVKLDTDDKRGLYLGNIIHDCCQFINGHARQCVIDGCTLSDNGFYVLLKKKIKKTEKSVTDKESNSPKDHIVAVSYSWNTVNGNLCLDSLERRQDHVAESTLKRIMDKFALQVMQHNPQIKYVNVGTGGQTPEQFAPRALLSERQKKGTEYGDAKFQYCIHSRLTPEVVEMLNSTPGFNQLSEEVKKKIQYLSAYLDAKDLSSKTISDMSSLLRICWFDPFPPIQQPLTAEDFKVLTFKEYQTLNPFQKQGISSFCKLLNCDSFDSFLPWLPTIPAQDLLNIGATTPRECGFTTLHMVASSYEHLEIILSLLDKGEQLAVIQAKDSHKETVLHLAAGNPESLRTILNAIPKEERLNVLQEKDLQTNTVLHLTSSNSKASKVILELLSEKERLALVKVKNKAKLTPLHGATRYPETLKVILELLPEEERLSAVQEQNFQRLSILHAVVDNLESLEVILKLLPKKDLLCAIQLKNYFGNTPLHLAIRYPEALEAILKLLSIPERLTAIQEKNHHNETVLHLAASNPKSLEVILELLPKEQRLHSVSKKTIHGETVLHQAASKPESLEVILKSLSEKECRAAIEEKNHHYETVLHLAASNPKSLEVILKRLSEEECRAAIEEKNHHYETVLHRAASNPKSLEVILELLPKEECRALVKEKTIRGETVLHRAVSNPKSLEVILELFSKEECRAVVQEKTNYGETVLHRAVSKPESLELILELLPKEQRRAVVQEKTNYGETVLHRAVSNPKSLEVILKRLSKEECCASVQEKTKDGETVLYRAVSNPQSLELILKRLSKEECRALAQEKTNYGETVLHRAVSNPQSLELILKLLPKEQRIAAVNVKNNNGETVLKLAEEDPELLSAILKLLPEKKAAPSTLEKCSMFPSSPVSTDNSEKKEPAPKKPRFS